MLDPMRLARGAIFDLDGVIVDTARYHYLAWRRLACELGFDFTLSDNERLKGVSRVRSLDILLAIGGVAADEVQKSDWLTRKNEWYLAHIATMTEAEILPGAREYLGQLRQRGRKIALGSASKNAPLILDRLGIAGLFDALVDGNKVAQAKPDPEVFLRAAHELGLPPSDCVIFEDAMAGIVAAHRAGMKVVGIGEAGALGDADWVVPGLHAFAPPKMSASML